ncbi:hypothetical protein C0991_005388 [Blastosporella zonata]|nr:hypothetical protein C0991_005388 [Blastosporella zonata]
MAANLFESLPYGVQRDIDQAFDNVATDAGAGFEPAQIPMSLVPSALQLLDLPPDDDQVLAVFRNAASGWITASSTDGGWVSREDWHAVCAVLLEEQTDNEADPYLEEDSGDDIDDEYVDRPSTSTSRPRIHQSSSPSLSPGPFAPRTLTTRQKQTALDAFSLFFPDVPQADVPKQKIMIKDIQRVAKLLNEKVKADEVCLTHPLPCTRCNFAARRCSRCSMPFRPPPTNLSV